MGIAGMLALVSLISNIGKNRIAFPLVPFLVLVYAVLGLLSTLLGGNVYYGIYKAVELLIDTTFLFAAVMQVGSLRDAKKLSDFVLLLFFLLLVTEVIAAIVIPEAGFYVYEKGVIGRLFSGAFPLMDPNGLGFLSGTLAVASACRILRAEHPKSKQLYILTLLFSLTTLTLAQSRTSILGMLAALAVVLALGKRWKEFAVILAIALVGFAIFSDYLISYIMRGQSVEMFKKVSGRTVMWEYVWNKFLERPVLGYGFVSAVFLMKIYAPGQTSPVFNSYLECLSNSGIIGFFPWFMAILVTFFLLLRGSMQSRYTIKNDLLQRFNIEKIGIMIVLLARSTTTSMLTIHSMEFTLFLTLIVAAQTNLFLSIRAVQTSLHGPAHV
jgi:O-antigen ligase